MAEKAKQRPISGTERMISAVIVCLLALIAVAVYLKSRSYDESLFNVTLTAEAGGAESNKYKTQSIELDGFENAGEIEFFGVDELYLKIDGKDGAYFAYDVISLEFRSFKRKESGEAVADDQQGAEEDLEGFGHHGVGQYIDIYLYDMGSPITAFGIYSIERSLWGEQAAIGRDAYLDGDSIFFWQGDYYGQVIASEPDIGLGPGVMQVARNLAAQLEDDGQPLPDLELLQMEGLKENTIKYLHKDALGQAFLGRLFVAEVERNGAEFTFFIHRAASAEEAGQIAEQYLDFIKSYGELKREFALADAQCWHGEMFGRDELFFAKGRLFGGVNGTDQPEEAEALLLAYLNQVDDQ